MKKLYHHLCVAEKLFEIILLNKREKCMSTVSVAQSNFPTEVVKDP